MGVEAFYSSNHSRLLWLSPAGQIEPQAVSLLRLVETAAADGIDPKSFSTDKLRKALAAARRGSPKAILRADRMASALFVRYVQDVRRPSQVPMIWVDPQLRPARPSPNAILSALAAAPSPLDFVRKQQWMHPIYAGLRMALESDGLSAEQRDQLRLNLERARVLPAAGRMVLVNAAAASLSIYERGSMVDSMKVVVGKPIYPTPMMAAVIRYTSLNPYWNVPPDLAAERIAPSVVKEGTGYLRRHGYQLLSDWSDDAKVIDPRSVDWGAVAKGAIQVRLRQLPGPSNAMGQMKFMFPNEQGVYLHDTPAKELLGEASRLFSGGCVRLEDAPRLARWLYGRPLRPDSRHPEQKVELPRPVPVFLTYFTALPADGKIAYLPDVYGRDRAALARSGTGGKDLAAR